MKRLRSCSWSLLFSPVDYILALKLWAWTPFMATCTGYNIVWYNVCQWLATGQSFSPDTPVSPTNKKWPPWYSWNIVESGVKLNNPYLMQIPVDDKYYLLLLKLALSTINQTKPPSMLIILYLEERRKTFEYIVNSIISTFIYYFSLDMNESNWQICPTNQKWTD